ncbi:pectinesterase family protein [Streptomyces sp. DSM 40750]|uniref:pectinesterase family protein n=1 Tax=Streptomyces sp. DSM 40750 TaxID=2801030 RepID=UPI00214CB970|nr:pectinesterase family protein [Streptomyces sp. DSM 40750]UUU19098.1 pectinesterase family protein [Streptomyces sp. DSM 40750]UUU27558.1 pectinesterase family protein [Streptomyces sp. DSM 40750]
MTDTEARGHLPRRSFLTSAIAVVAAGTLAGGLVVAAAPAADALDGANFTWMISSEMAEAKVGYANMLNAIRQAVRGGRVGSMGGPPIDVTDRNGAGQYITIDLHAENGIQFARLFMRRSDSYIMGWRGGIVDGGGTVTWHRFFTLDPAAAPGGAAALPGATVTNTIRVHETLGSYTALAQQGATRDGMQITPASLSNAVQRLEGADSESGSATPTTRELAQAILQVIVGVAEASRFREQARETAVAFGRGVAFALTATHREFHNNWGRISRAALLAVMAGSAVLAAPLEVAGIVIATVAVAAQYVMTAHHSDLDTRGKHLSEGALLYVSPDGDGDHWTVQAAIDDVPDSGANTILISKGVYHEVISVSSSKSWLTIQGVTGIRGDVTIYNTRCHGMINPETGLKYGTQGSAVATFRPPNLTVKDLTISNTFDRAAHPEISPYETQAVAVAAMGDRQVFDNVAILSRQDTLLVKGETPTTQARQYFYNCLIRGDVDFIFGNATAVIDQSQIVMYQWPGGTMLAPNTDYRKKYGILVTHSWVISNNVPARSMYLGRPWHNVPEAHPQAVVRNTNIYPHINETHPWTDMVPEYPWSWARFKEYQNTGTGAGVGSNAPKLTDAEAADYTAQKYLAGTDGWNPVR